MSKENNKEIKQEATDKKFLVKKIIKTIIILIIGV